MNGAASTVHELIERQAALRPQAVYAVAVDAEPRAQQTADLTAHAEGHRTAAADTEPSLSFGQLAQACRAVGDRKSVV